MGVPIGTSRNPNQYFARFASAMDMAPQSSAAEIIEELVKRNRNPIKPVLVKDGPCKENILTGKDIDLLKFPAPYLHEGDGGRYIGAWHLVVAKDPDSDWVNWGMYRLMVHDRNTLGGLVHPNQNWGQILYPSYEARNKPREFAIAIGTEPVCSIVAASMYREGQSEVNYAGAIRKEPVELVKCETVDLEVPATAEIVIEGVIMPHERKDEGPFGEFTGYMASDKRPRPVLHVKAITHRNDPILTISCPGPPVDDSSVVLCLGISAQLLDDLRSRGFKVKMVYLPLEAISNMVVVSTQVPFPNYARYLANAIWGSRAGRNAFYLMIAEDDVDVTDTTQILWTLATRCHPYNGIFRVQDTVGHPLLPFLTPQERRGDRGAQVLFDCTWPKDWAKEDIPRKASFDNIWPVEIQEKVLKNWTNYGYKKY